MEEKQDTKQRATYAVLFEVREIEGDHQVNRRVQGEEEQNKSARTETTNPETAVKASQERKRE